MLEDLFEADPLSETGDRHSVIWILEEGLVFFLLRGEKGKRKPAW